MPTPRYQLQWMAESVANILHNNGIENRSQLAEVLGISRPTIVRTFDKNWAGAANATVLAQMAGQFGVPLSRLVIEPSVVRRSLAAKAGAKRRTA